MSEEAMINVVRAKEALRVRLGDVERERDRLRADLEAAREENIKLDALIDRGLYAEIDRLQTDLAQSHATEAELRARVERLERVAEAARHIDPKDRSFAMDDALAALDAQEPRT